MAGRIVAVFVLEAALEDQKLFAERMFVGREGGAGRVAHDAGGTRDLVADAVEQPPLDTRQRRCLPR